VDGSGGLYVADQGNNRVLYYPKGSTTATVVYGQPDMSSRAKHAGATGFDKPDGVAADDSGGLYVADESNNRVLYYPKGSTKATLVYGQPDMNGSARRTGAGGLNEPAGVVVDGSGGFYVADEYNNRVLHFLGTVPVSPGSRNPVR